MTVKGQILYGLLHIRTMPKFCSRDALLTVTAKAVALAEAFTTYSADHNSQSPRVFNYKCPKFFPPGFRKLVRKLRHSHPVHNVIFRQQCLLVSNAHLQGREDINLSPSRAICLESSSFGVNLNLLCRPLSFIVVMTREFGAGSEYSCIRTK